jgi:two-component system, LytTR family, sensor kinase
MTRSVRETFRDAGIVVVAWAAIATLDALSDAARDLYNGHPEQWGQSVRDAMLDWWTCGLFAPVFVVLVRRFPLTVWTDWRRWLLYGSVMSAAAIVKFALYFPLRQAFHPIPHATLIGMLLGGFVSVCFGYVSLIAVLHAARYYRDMREREVRAALLEASLSRAQLDALNVQLQPHFLFNTLNGIAALMHRDVEAADEMIARLSDLLRLTLERGQVEEVTLADELALLERYVDIMRVRFQDRLTVDIGVQPDAMPMAVPHFLLQPLVENAIQHGVDRVRGSCTVLIEAGLRDGNLAITLCDRGPGFSPHAARRGIGLRNTIARLEHLYGDRARIETSSLADGGGCVALLMPAHPLREALAT